MSDTPSPYPLNPYQPSNVTATDATGFAVAGSSVPPGAIEALRRTRPWVLFIAILGAIFTGFMLLAGLGMMAGGGFIQEAMKQSSGMPANSPFNSFPVFLVFGVIYLIFAGLYLYPVIKLFKFSGAISSLTVSGAPADLENALHQQRGFWKFTGIIVIVGIIAYIVLIILMVAFGGFAAASAARQQQVPAPAPVQTVP